MSSMCLTSEKVTLCLLECVLCLMLYRRMHVTLNKVYIYRKKHCMEGGQFIYCRNLLIHILGCNYLYCMYPGWSKSCTSVQLHCVIFLRAYVATASLSPTPKLYESQQYISYICRIVVSIKHISATICIVAFYINIAVHASGLLCSNLVVHLSKDQHVLLHLPQASGPPLPPLVLDHLLAVISPLLPLITTRQCSLAGDKQMAESVTATS